MIYNIAGLNYYDNKLMKNVVEMFSCDLTNDLVDAIIQYLYHQLHPGGFFAAVLANDFNGAILRAHPALTTNAIKEIAYFVQEIVPPEAKWSYDTVNSWLSMPAEDAFQILVRNGLRHSKEDLILLELNKHSIGETL